MQKLIQMKSKQLWKSTETPCFARSPAGLGNTVLLCTGKMLSRKCFSCFKNYTPGCYNIDKGELLLTRKVIPCVKHLFQLKFTQTCVINQVSEFAMAGMEIV